MHISIEFEGQFPVYWPSVEQTARSLIHLQVSSLASAVGTAREVVVRERRKKSKVLRWCMVDVLSERRRQNALVSVKTFEVKVALWTCVRGVMMIRNIPGSTAVFKH